jgi:hypothetical protein
MPGITPFRPNGIGADTTNAYNVLKISFDQSLSDIPILTAYDDYNISTVNNTLFIGTVDSGNKPLIAAVSGINGVSSTYFNPLSVPPGWFPASAYGGNAPRGTANFLNGGTDGILLDTTATVSGTGLTFNLGYKIWQDLTTLATMSGVVICRYQFTGQAAPNVSVYGNSGSQGSPSWTLLVPYATGTPPVIGDLTQIRPCDTGKGFSGDGTYRQTIPSPTAVFPAEIWLKNY